MSTAAGIKLFRQLCTTNCLWANQTRTCFSENNIWDAFSKLQDLGTIKFILSCKEIAASYIRMKIGNSRDTNVWSEPWLPQGQLQDSIQIAITANTHKMSVSDLMVDGSWQMKLHV